MTKKDTRGFTLIEILLVVAIIAILAGIVIIALNPAKNLADTRNAQRRMDVPTIIDAVYQYAVDRNGQIPTTITTSSMDICKSTVATSTCGSYINLTDTLVANETYLVGIPVDPLSPSGASSGYMIQKTPNDRVTVSAPLAEQGATVSISR